MCVAHSWISVSLRGHTEVLRQSLVECPTILKLINESVWLRECCKGTCVGRLVHAKLGIQICSLMDKGYGQSLIL